MGSPITAARRTFFSIGPQYSIFPDQIMPCAPGMAQPCCPCSDALCSCCPLALSALTCHICHLRDAVCCADTAALPYNAFCDHLDLPEVAIEAAAAEAARSVPGKRILVKHKMSFHRARIRAVRPHGPGHLPQCT